MTCQQTQDLLHGYIDGELDLPNNLNIERHFDECELCAIEYDNQLTLKTLIQEKGEYFQAPESLEKRIEKSVAGGNGGKRKRAWISQNWWRAAAVVILILSAVVIWKVIC